jgi:hypothetical protein
MWPIAFTVLGAITVVPNTLLRVKGATLLSLLVKTVCGLLFVLAAVAAILTNDGWALGHVRLRLGFAVVVGLVACLLGDIWLALKELAPKDHDAYMFLGMAFFALGHVAFILGLLMTYPGARAGAGWAFLAALAVAGGVIAAERPLKLKFGQFRWVAAFYGFALCSGVALALATAASGQAGGVITPQPLVMGLGGVSFIVSDAVLASAYFGPGKDKAWNHALCYVFYYGAQFTIALSLLAL